MEICFVVVEEVHQNFLIDLWIFTKMSMHLNYCDKVMEKILLYNFKATDYAWLNATTYIYKSWHLTEQSH